LWVDGDAVTSDAVTTHRAEIVGEVLALSVTTGTAPANATVSSHEVGGVTATIGVQRA
jgi:hypothetical protein